MSFKDMVAADIRNVFLNLEEFAERRTVEYDGERYEDIAVVLSSPKEKDRDKLTNDHVPGLHLASFVLHCSIDDLGGKLPEHGTNIKISTKTGGSFLKKYFIANSSCEMGLVACELEVVAQ